MNLIRGENAIIRQNNIGKALVALAMIVVLVFHAFAQTVTVNTGTTYQTIKRWEGNAQTGSGDFLSSGENYRDAALTAAVASGINGLRIDFPSGLVENSTDYWGNYVADGRDFSTNAAYSAYTANAYIPVNDNADPNSINASGFKFSYVDWSIDKYVAPMKTKLAAQNETLWWSLCYVHFSASNRLHITTASEYGELILATWQHINATYGYVPTALEIILEPDGTSATTASELAAMIIAARDRLVNAGFAKPYIIAPSTASGPNARVMYENVKTANATAAGYIDEISYHRYVDMDAGLYGLLRTDADADSKNTGMLEWSATGAGLAAIYDDLALGKVSGWQEFAISYPGSEGPGVYFYVTGSGPYVVNKGNRVKYYENYFKYVRANAQMKGVTNSSGNFLGLPFRNANGTYVVVIKAATSGTVSVASLPAGTYKACVTIGNGTADPSTYNSCGSDQVITTGNASITFSGAGVGTVYDINYLAANSSVGLTGSVKIQGGASIK